MHPTIRKMIILFATSKHKTFFVGTKILIQSSRMGHSRNKIWQWVLVCLSTVTILGTNGEAIVANVTKSMPDRKDDQPTVPPKSAKRSEALSLQKDFASPKVIRYSMSYFIQKFKYIKSFLCKFIMKIALVQTKITVTDLPTRYFHYLLHFIFPLTSRVWRKLSLIKVL